MKIKYYNGIGEHVEVVNDLYRDVATLLAAESIDHPTEVKVTNTVFLHVLVHVLSWN